MLRNCKVYETKIIKKIKITMQQVFQIVNTYVFVGEKYSKVETETKVTML